MNSVGQSFMPCSDSIIWDPLPEKIEIKDPEKKISTDEYEGDSLVKKGDYK